MGENAPRTLGLADLFFYASATSLSIRWISVSAAAGPASLPLWAGAVLLFGGPLVVATAELTGRFDHEGGVYAWTAGAFGPFWGFLCGWLYWVCNLPFFASMLVFMVNFTTPGLGPAGQSLLAHPALFAAATVGLAVAVGLTHLAGLGAGRWISNVGGASNVVLVAVLAATAIAVALRHGPATDLAHASYAPRLDATGAILWATMVFAIVGPESVAFLRNEVRGGMRTILVVLAMVALAQIAFYVAGTGAILAILTPAAATRLSGLPDALTTGLSAVGLGATAPLALIGGFLCALGLYSAWFGVAARLPFAAGIDAYLPAAFGRRDPRTGAPVVAIATQTVIVVAIVLAAQAGETLKAAYDFLVAMSVLSTTLPFLLVFAVFLVVQSRPPPPHAWRTPGGPAVARLIGAVGLAATALAVGCTLVPSPDARDPLGEVSKLVAASALLILSGVGFYWLAERRRAAAAKLLTGA
jgi:amino acid transporter